MCLWLAVIYLLARRVVWVAGFSFNFEFGVLRVCVWGGGEQERTYIDKLHQRQWDTERNLIPQALRSAPFPAPLTTSVYLT